MLVPQELVALPEPTPSLPSNGTLICERTGAPEEQNQYVRYASQISGGNIDFLATLTAENGLWDPYRQAVSGEPSYGFCQIHAGYHPGIVNDPRFFSDPFWQLDQCWALYSGGTRFYGFDVRTQFLDDFTCYYQ